MPGTILKDDLQSSIEDQLNQYASELTAAPRRGLQVIGDTAADLAQAGRTSAQDVQAQLSDYATQAYNQAQEAQRQAAQAAADKAAAVQKELLDHANQAIATNQSQTAPPQQSIPAAAGAPDHEPSPPLQTAGTQVANTPGAGGQVFPLSVRPDNAPTATYHSQGGSDLMAPRGTPVLNMQNGRVDEVFTDNGSHTVGGNAVLVHGDDGLDYYYAHFDQPSGVKVGQRVAVGEQIGAVGNSGNAYKGGSGATHLHIGIGHGISNGVGSEGGLGEDYNAQSLLTQLQDGIGKASSTAPVTAPLQAPAQQQQAVGGANEALDRNGVVTYVKQKAKEYGLDPAAVLAVANQEGLNTDPGTHWQLPGERNISFGPPSWYGNGAGADILAKHGDDAARWSWTPEGLDYWLAQVAQAKGTVGATGADAIHAIVTNFERPREDLVAGEIGKAQQQYANFVGDVQGAVTSAVDQTVGGATQKAKDVLQVGTDALGGAQDRVAKAPIVYDSQTGGAQTPQQQLTAIQNQLNDLQAQLANAPEQARQAVGGAAGAAGETIGGAASALGGAVSQTNQTLRTGASDLGSSRAADIALRSGRTQAEEDQLGQQQLGAAQQIAQQNQPGAATQPPTLGEVGSSVVNLLTGANPGQGITLGDYTSSQQAKNQWIEQNNPARDVLVLGGLTTGIAQQLTDPAMLVAFGPTTSLGRAAGARVGEAVGGALTDRLAPRVVQGVQTVAERLTSGGLANGLQMAIVEAEKPDATPLSVGQGFLQGAALGGVIDAGAPAAKAVIGRIGQQILDRAPDIRPALGDFLRSEQGATRIPGQGPQVDVLHGQAVPRPGYEPGTPEHTTETFLQDQARAQGTPTPQLSAADIGGLPGMAGSRMRGIQEVRDAVDAGLPAARWYQEMVQQIRQDTGQDINPREAAVLMGAFGGNAGVTPNYHAMLSVFDAMRQAKPDLTGFENMTPEQVQGTQAFKDVAALFHGDASYGDDSMLARVMRGYRTGEIPVPSGAKLSSYTQDFLHALNEQYSPYTTQDVWQGRLFGARPDIQGGNGLPNVSQNDQAYRTMHALTNWVAREMNLPPEQAQAAGWTVFRTLWNDATIGPELRNDRIGLSDAIKQGQQAGLLDPKAMAAGGLAEVTAPRTGVPTSWISKLNDVRDRIQQNGSYNAAPPESATAVNQMALYHPSIQSRAQQRTRLDPIGQEYGLVSGPKTGVARPVGSEPAGALRDLALGDQPVLRVKGELNVDPTTGKIPWLLPEHDVQVAGGHTYVTVTGVGDDAAHLIGQRLGADRFNHADPTSTNLGGMSVELGSRADQARVTDALNAAGLPVLREQAGTNIRVPLVEGKPQALARTLQKVLSDHGITGTIGDYKGDTHAVRSARSGGAGRNGNPPGAGRSLGVSPGNSLPTSLFRDARESAYGAPGFVAPTGRQRGELGQLPFGINVAGGVAGGYAGNLATPQDAPPEERLRNIGLGATAGLVGTHLLTRGGLRLAPEGARSEPGGFRAPERAAGPELRATTQEPPGGPPTGGPTGPAPRSLGEVATNRYALREARPGETPMTQDELSSHYDTMDARLQQVQARSDAVDEMLRNPGQKVERPPWATGYTSEQVATMARSVDHSPFEPLWWEKAGLESGSGEVRELLNESGGGAAAERGAGQRDLTPAELRAERNDLAKEKRDILAAGEQLGNAPQDARLVRAAPDQPTGELPFDRGTADVPAPEATAASGAGGGKDEGARLAQEIVTNKGRIRSDESGVTAESQGVTGRGITAPEAEPTTPMSAETQRLMPNLHALLGEDMPEVAAQLQKAVEDNPELFQAYQQGRISMESLRNDLAQRVGMSTQDWLHTKVGQAFNEREQVALQAAMIESQGRQTDLARDIQAKGGVDALLPEQIAYSIHSLVDAQRLAAVARGGRATAGRSLNALKQRFTRELASSITASNERKAAQRTADQARRAVKRSNDLLTKTRTLETERDAVLQRNGVDPATAPNGAVGTERTVRGQPPNIIDQIAQAYDELDRYNALSLHEKEADFKARRAERDKLAAQRKAVVRDAPDELLKALQNELKWERGNFAKRKDTWETMAFWDSKAGENAAKARADFRGGLYIEQQRRVAQNALKEADTTASQAFDAEMRRRDNQSAKAQRLLESMGGVEVNKELLQNFVNAINDPDPMVAAKFIQGTIKPSNWMRANAIRLAGLLSSPITHMVNVGGNISGAMVEVPTRALVVGIDAMRAAATGGERQAYAGELLPMLKAYGPGVLSGLPEAVRIMKTGMSTEDIANLNRIRPGFNSGNAGVDLAVEAPLRALKAEDALFSAGAHSAHAMRVATREAIREGYSGPQVQGRAASIIKNLVDYPELATEVELATKRQVFQEKRTVPGMPSGIGQNDVSRFATSQVLPFVRTPANITAQGAGMSPFGVLGVGEALRGVSGKEGAARGRQVLLAEERAARTVLGSLIFGAGLAVGGAGMLTGAYPTDSKEASTLPQGWRAWSLRVGDPVTKNTYYVPLQNLGPMGFPLALSAILTDPQHRGKTVLDPDEQINAATAIGRYVIDNTFLQGVSDVVDLLHDPKTGASKFMEPYAASWGPYSSLAREMQRVMGVATRNPHDGAIGLVEALEANYPGLSGNVPEATTSLGDPRTQGATGLGRALPLRYDIERDEPTLKALRDNGVGIPPQTKAISLSGGSIPLTEAEQDQLKRARGAAIRDIVPRVGNNPAALQRAVELATAAATRQFISQMGAAEVRKRWEPKQAPEPYYLGTAAD